MNNIIKRKSPYGVLSLTLGIISIVYAYFWNISLPAGIIAIILGNKGRDTVGSKTSVAGKIIAIIGASISLAILGIKAIIMILGTM